MRRANKSKALDKSPIHLLHRASQCVTELFSNEIKSDLTPRQLAVLTAIAEAEGCSQNDISDRTGIDRSTIAGMIRRLKTRGLLERRRTSRDARAYAVKLTDLGRRQLRSAEPLAKSVDEKILRALGSRRSAFLDNLAALAAHLESAQKA